MVDGDVRAQVSASGPNQPSWHAHCDASVAPVVAVVLPAVQGVHVVDEGALLYEPMAHAGKRSKRQISEAPRRGSQYSMAASVSAGNVRVHKPPELLK